MKHINRREFLFLGSAGLFASRSLFGAAGSGEPVVRFGMVTDIHFADAAPDSAPIGVVGRRFYRESCEKLRLATDVFNARKLDFAIELGDFKDLSGTKEATLRYLDLIEECFARFRGPRYHVAGNHDFDCLSPSEFLSRVPNDGKVSPAGYYSFTRSGITFIVLNACYDGGMKPYDNSNPWDDANIPPAELSWLEGELARAPGPAFVFCHQRLDTASEPRHRVKNAATVRAALEKSGKVKGVFTGHQHKGGMSVENGIPYYSLRALVCDSGTGANSFAEVAVWADGNFTVNGWYSAASRGARGQFPERGVIAHRGDAADFPENTIPAFRAAVAKGAEMVELDEWRCWTGELVVMHDPKLNRTTNGHGRISDWSLNGLKRLDAGIRKHPRFADERIPTLSEALAAFPRTGVWLNIHCKTGDAAPEVAEILRRTGRLAQGILMMDSRKLLVELKAKCPWVKTGLVACGARGPWTEDKGQAFVDDVVKLGVDFLQMLPGQHLTRAQLDKLHDHNIRTTYFFANTPEMMRELVAEGHDFIFTDFYSKLRPVYDAAIKA